jgi:hypothetical protein
MALALIKKFILYILFLELSLNNICDPVEKLSSIARKTHIAESEGNCESKRCHPLF